MSTTLKTPDHITAFGFDFSVIWAGTPFVTEANNLAYFRQFTCFLGSSANDIADRRKLMHTYLSNDFSTENTDDTINKLYNVIPVRESLNRILRNLCSLYELPPNREFQTKNEKIPEIYALGNINRSFRRAHKVAKLCNTALIMPHVRNGKIEIDILPPDLFRFDTDENDFRKIKSLWIPISRIDENGNSVYSFKKWTDEFYTELNAQGIVTKELPNRYGLIPACVLQFDNSDTTDFYGGGYMELLLATLDNNKLTFLADNDVVYSAFSVWLATNFGVTNVVKLAPNRILRAEGQQMGEGFDVPASLENIAGNAVFQNIELMRQDRYKMALRDAGLPESLVSANPGLAPSGAALRQDKMEMMGIRKEDTEVMVNFENEFYTILAKVVNSELGLNIPEQNTVIIDYVETQEFIEPVDEKAILDGQFQAGIIGAKDYLAGFVSVDTIKDNRAAIDYMIENKKLLLELNIETNPMVQDGNVPKKALIIDNTKA